jgi:hypothetical protein
VDGGEEVRSGGRGDAHPLHEAGHRQVGLIKRLYKVYRVPYLFHLEDLQVDFGVSVPVPRYTRVTRYRIIAWNNFIEDFKNIYNFFLNLIKSP